MKNHPSLAITMCALALLTIGLLSPLLFLTTVVSCFFLNLLFRQIDFSALALKSHALQVGQFVGELIGLSLFIAVVTTGFVFISTCIA